MSAVAGSSTEVDERRKMRILEVKMNPHEAAQQLLEQAVRERKVDLTILSEHGEYSRRQVVAMTS